MSEIVERPLVNQYMQVHSVARAEQDEPALMQGFPAGQAQRVTWSNWMRPPFNRWGFRHLARLRPTIDVQAGRSSEPLPVALQPLGSLSFQSVCGLSVNVMDHLLASKTDGFLVMHRGRVVHERYFNGQQATDRHIMFSVTKSLIGVLGEQLVHQGLLDDTLQTQAYVPELQGSAFGDATVRSCSTWRRALITARCTTTRTRKARNTVMPAASSRRRPNTPAMPRCTSTCRHCKSAVNTAVFSIM